MNTPVLVAEVKANENMCAPDGGRPAGVQTASVIC